MFAVTIKNLRLTSPMLNASGCFNPGMFSQLFPLQNALGGIVTKTVTATPRIGNPQQRTVELAGIGMLNSIGLQNPGLDYFLEKESLILAEHQLPLFLSISACSLGEFEAMTRQVAEHPNGRLVRAIEINLSCPNVEKGGVDFGNSAETVREAVKIVRDNFDGLIFAKLTPNVTDIVPIAEAAVNGGADGLTAINTVLGVAIDVKTRKPAISRVAAGYSGPGVKPIALRAVWQIHKHLPEIPVMAVGGITNATDVLEFLMAGATLVQVGTACFRHPDVFVRLVQDLQDYGEREKLENLQELVGCAHPETIPAPLKATRPVS